MEPARKIAFIGSHSVRKTNAVHSFAGAVGRSGRSVEVGREVVRFSPLGLNEGATPEAQLWTITAQIRQELELRTAADVLVLDRAVIDNFAYFLRATGGAAAHGSRPDRVAGGRWTVPGGVDRPRLLLVLRLGFLPRARRAPGGGGAGECSVQFQRERHRRRPAAWSRARATRR